MNRMNLLCAESKARIEEILRIEKVKAENPTLYD